MEPTTLEEKITCKGICFISEDRKKLDREYYLKCNNCEIYMTSYQKCHLRQDEISREIVELKMKINDYLEDKKSKLYKRKKDEILTMNRMVFNIPKFVKKLRNSDVKKIVKKIKNNIILYNIIGTIMEKID